MGEGEDNRELIALAAEKDQEKWRLGLLGILSDIRSDAAATRRESVTWPKLKEHCAKLHANGTAAAPSGILAQWGKFSFRAAHVRDAVLIIAVVAIALLALSRFGVLPRGGVKQTQISDLKSQIEGRGME